MFASWATTQVIDLAWFILMGAQMLIATTGILIILHAGSSPPHPTTAAAPPHVGGRIGVSNQAFHAGVWIYSDVFLLFLWVLSFCMSIVTLCFLLSVFFSKSKTAASVGPMIFFALYFPL